VSETYSLLVDSFSRDVVDAEVDESLLFVLRERLGVTSVKDACSTGQCGACTVLVDGSPHCACLVLAAAATDAAITTLDGLAGTPSATEVQGAFVDAGAVQCGFCTPGVIVQTHDLLARVSEPTDADVREALAGNLCRCTGYGRIVAAVQLAAERLRERAG
jgi:carbon-monoxide dehydrogenase small subunit